MKRFFQLIIATGLLSGCATIETLPDREFTANRTQALEGATYALPVLQYELKIDRTLTKCPSIKNGEYRPPEFTLSVEAEGRYVAGERYRIAYTKLAGPLNTSDFVLKLYGNGTLKSVGLTGEDKTDDAIKSIAGLTGSVLALSAGTPLLSDSPLTTEKAVRPPPEFRPRDRYFVKCKDDVASKVETYADRKSKLLEHKDAIEALNSKLTDFGRRVSLKLVDPTDPTVRLQWEADFNALIAAQQAASDFERQIPVLKKALSASMKATWPKDIHTTLYDASSTYSDVNSSKVSGFIDMFEAVPTSAVNSLDTVPGSVDRFEEYCAVLEGNDASITQGLSNRSGSFYKCVERALMVFVEMREVGLSQLPASTEDNIDFIEGYVSSFLEAGPPIDGLTGEELDWPWFGDAQQSYLDGQPLIELLAGLSEENRDELLRQSGLDSQRWNDLANPTVLEERIRILSEGDGVDSRDQRPDNGIFYRDARLGILQVCAAKDARGRTCSRTAEIKGIKPVNFPQFGQLRFAEFVVPLFKKKDMKIELTASGQLAYFHMRSQKSAAATALSAASSAAKTIADDAEARETERRSDIAYLRGEEVAGTKAEIERLTKEKELAELIAGPSPADPATAAAAALELDIAQRRAELTQMLLIAAQSGDIDLTLQILGALE